MNFETGTSYSREQLLAAFNSVCNKDNWKMPIDAIVEDPDYDMIKEAVAFFAGCKPSFEPIHGTDRVRVQAVGYYQAVGA